MKEWEDKLSLDIKLPDLESKPIEEQILLILKKRLQYEEEFMPRWREAMILGSMPQNVPVISQRLFSTMNTVWDMLGDKSTGLQWYTRRIITGQIFVTTELNMVHDGSLKFIETWDFLQMQLEQQKFDDIQDLPSLWYKYANGLLKYAYPK